MVYWTNKKKRDKCSLIKKSSATFAENTDYKFWDIAEEVYLFKNCLKIYEMLRNCLFLILTCVAS